MRKGSSCIARGLAVIAVASLFDRCLWLSFAGKAILVIDEKSSFFSSSPSSSSSRCFAFALLSVLVQRSGFRPPAQPRVLGSARSNGGAPWSGGAP